MPFCNANWKTLASWAYEGKGAATAANAAAKQNALQKAIEPSAAEPAVVRVLLLVACFVAGLVDRGTFLRIPLRSGGLAFDRRAVTLFGDELAVFGVGVQRMTRVRIRRRAEQERVGEAVAGGGHRLGVGRDLCAHTVIGAGSARVREQHL